MTNEEAIRLDISSLNDQRVTFLALFPLQIQAISIGETLDQRYSLCNLIHGVGMEAISPRSLLYAASEGTVRPEAVCGEGGTEAC
jgi:hypothetical protein